jgi:hypothetical protein
MVHFYTVITQNSDRCDALVIGRDVEVFKKYRGYLRLTGFRWVT